MSQTLENFHCSLSFQKNARLNLDLNSGGLLTGCLNPTAGYKLQSWALDMSLAAPEMRTCVFCWVPLLFAESSGAQGQQGSHTRTSGLFPWEEALCLSPRQVWQWRWILSWTAEEHPSRMKRRELCQEQLNPQFIWIPQGRAGAHP